MISYLANRDTGQPSVRRDAGTGLAWFVVGVLLLWLPEIAIIWGPRPGPDPGTWSVLTLVVACAAAPLRRVQAVTGLLIATCALIAGAAWTGRTEIGTLLVFTDLLYCAVLYPSRRAARVVAASAGIVVAVLALVALITAGGRTAVLSVLNLGLVVGIPLVWGAEVRRHRDLAELERARAAEAARAAARERETAIAAERARMARDLHDVVAGRLSAIALQSEAALQPGTDPELARRVLGTIRESGVAALGEMRAMIGLLRAGDAADPPLAPGRLSELDALVDDARRAGLDVRLDDERPAGLAIPAAVELTGYRIVQESLTNAVKHAPGSTVRIRLAAGSAREPLRLEIRNGGAAGPVTDAPGARAGTGLAGLAERAGAVGGRCDAGPDGDGWAVRAVLPFDGAASAS